MLGTDHILNNTQLTIVTFRYFNHYRFIRDLVCIQKHNNSPAWLREQVVHQTNSRHSVHLLSGIAHAHSKLTILVFKYAMQRPYYNYDKIRWAKHSRFHAPYNLIFAVLLKTAKFQPSECFPVYNTCTRLTHAYILILCNQ